MFLPTVALTAIIFSFNEQEEDHEIEDSKHAKIAGKIYREVNSSEICKTSPRNVIYDAMSAFMYKPCG